MAEGGPAVADLYREAAEAGHLDAMVDLGALLEGDPVTGEGRDVAEAARLFTAAAGQGHARGLFRLAQLTEYGRGVPQSWEGATRLYLASAALGHPHAHFSLGVLFCRDLPDLGEYGSGRQLRRAKAHFEAAAARGFESARRALQRPLFRAAVGPDHAHGPMPDDEGF